MRLTVPALVLGSLPSCSCPVTSLGIRAVRASLPSSAVQPQALIYRWTHWQGISCVCLHVISILMF